MATQKSTGQQLRADPLVSQPLDAPTAATAIRSCLDDFWDASALLSAIADLAEKHFGEPDLNADTVERLTRMASARFTAIYDEMVALANRLEPGNADVRPVVSES